MEARLKEGVEQLTEVHWETDYYSVTVTACFRNSGSLYLLLRPKSQNFSLRPKSYAKSLKTDCPISVANA